MVQSNATDLPRRTRILIAVPLHHGVCHAFRKAQVKLERAKGAMEKDFNLEVDWQEFEGCGLTIARNLSVAFALAHDYDELIFLAGDTGFPSHNLAAVINRLHHQLATYEFEVVGGTYLYKRHPPQVVSCQDEEGRQPNGDGLVEVQYAGTDCVAIKTEVFRKIIHHWPLISMQLYGAVIPLHCRHRVTNDGSFGGDYYNLFSEQVVVGEDGERELLPEDFYFFRLAHLAGCRIAVDSQIRLQHWGTYNYDAATVSGIEEALTTVNPPPIHAPRP